jgi:hypothetical protein
MGDQTILKFYRPDIRNYCPSCDKFTRFTHIRNVGNLPDQPVYQCTECGDERRDDPGTVDPTSQSLGTVLQFQKLSLTL